MHKRFLIGLTVGLTAVAMSIFAGVARADDQGFIDKFEVKPADFASVGLNSYFILKPGYQHVYEGEEEGKAGRLIISVLDETKMLDGVETRVVEERESSEGQLVEVSRNYFAIDKNTNDVYYFGEDVDEYKDGKVKSHSGSWHAGEKGAHYGLFMPAKPQVGQKYYQEIAPKVAMDRFEIVSVTETEKAPAGDFKDCVKTKETTPIEPDTTEFKLYAPAVGLVVDGGLKLVKHGMKIEPLNGDAKDKGAAKAGATTKAAHIVPLDVAREALNMVGADPNAEALWSEAINDPSMSAHDRQDLIEDLNENGFADPENVTMDELPLVMSRLDLIERSAPDAMDDVNAAAFAEAYKDLYNIANRLLEH